MENKTIINKKLIELYEDILNYENKLALVSMTDLKLEKEYTQDITCSGSEDVIGSVTLTSSKDKRELEFINEDIKRDSHQFDIEYMQAMIRIIRMDNNLESLKIKSISIPEEMTSELASAIASNHGIKQLVLNDCDNYCSSENFAELIKDIIDKNKKLEELCACDNEVNDSSIKIIFDRKKNLALKKLNLSGNYITGTGLMVLMDNIDNISSIKINLSNNEILAYNHWLVEQNLVDSIDLSDQRLGEYEDEEEDTNESEMHSLWPLFQPFKKSKSSEGNPRNILLLPTFEWFTDTDKKRKLGSNAKVKEQTVETKEDLIKNKVMNI